MVGNVIRHWLWLAKAACVQEMCIDWRARRTRFYVSDLSSDWTHTGTSWQDEWMIVVDLDTRDDLYEHIKAVDTASGDGKDKFQNTTGDTRARI